MKKKNVIAYLVGIALSLGVGLLSAALTKGGMGLYEKIKTPPFAPPSWLFPAVWTVLFVLMGISAARIYLARDKNRPAVDRALWLFGISLVLNFTWSLIFFNAEAFLFAFVWILALLCSIVLTILAYVKIDRPAAYLQIPYLVWVTFAAVLNLSIFLLNR